MQEALQVLYDEHQAMRSYLLTNGEISFANELESTSPKVLLLAAASYCESAIVSCVVEYFCSAMGTDESVRIMFVKRQALERKYFQLFNWESKNVNKFWSLFGSDFQAYAKTVVAGDEDLQNSIKSFLELGHLRNQLVHENYLQFQLQKTTDEIFAQAVEALGFVNALPGILSEFEE